MNNKISVTIDLSKLDKTRIFTRRYTTKEGVEVTVKEYKMDVVPLKEKKVLKEGDTWRLVKSHFVCDAPNKSERDAKVKTNFIGDGVQFENIGGDDVGGDSVDGIPF